MRHPGLVLAGVDRDGRTDERWCRDVRCRSFFPFAGDNDEFHGVVNGVACPSSSRENVGDPKICVLLGGGKVVRPLLKVKEAIAGGQSRVEQGRVDEVEEERRGGSDGKALLRARTRTGGENGPGGRERMWAACVMVGRKQESAGEGNLGWAREGECEGDHGVTGGCYALARYGQVPNGY
jgi:hypothetical protein